MRSQILLNAALVGFAAAAPSCPYAHLHEHLEPEGHEFIPAGPEDSRSPCVGLNVLANHGWLPRSGKNIDLPTIIAAVTGALNFAPDVDVVVGAFGAVQHFNLSTTGNASTFHLEDLKRHDTIEFDGSLSRNDFWAGDNLHFDPAIWAQTAGSLDLYSTDETEVVTVEMAAKARAVREANARAANPGGFNDSDARKIGTFGTSAFYMTSLWDAEKNGAPKSWVRAWFESERHPYKEGYKKPEQQTTSKTVSDMDNALRAVEV